MEEGAFALIDCLGFKGIWKRAAPSLLLEKLSKIEETVVKQISEDESFKHFSSPVKPRIRLLSDTVAISLQYEKIEGEDVVEGWQKDLLVALTCDSVIQVLDLFLKDEPHLVLRGCISYGEHISEGNYIVGPAVDDAAEYMNVAEGAFIWLLPSAALRHRNFRARMTAFLETASSNLIKAGFEILQKRGRDVSWALEAIEKYGDDVFGETFLSVVSPFKIIPSVIDPYDMPLKSGARLRCAVLNPLAFHRSAEERRATIEKYSRIITGNQLGIWLKHQHTMDLLEIADREAAKFEEALAEIMKDETQANSEE